MTHAAATVTSTVGRALGTLPAAMDDDSLAVVEVQLLARELLPECHRLADLVTGWVLDVVPDVAPGRLPEAVEVVRESTEQNIGAVLAMLAFGAVPGEIEPPPGTLKVVRQTAAAGGDLTTVLRAYHLGHAFVSRLWLDHVGRRISDPERMHGVVEYSSERMFAFFDSACEHLRTRFQRELPMTSGGTPLDPRAAVDALLTGQPVEAAAVEMALGYDLRQHHVGLVAAPAVDRADVREAIGCVAQRLRGRQTVVLPAGDGTWWAWVAFATLPDEAVLAEVASLPVTSVFVGVGEPGHGPDGFRATHEQARDAERVGRLSPASTARVIRQRDVELVALLCSDPGRARRLVADRLGPLAAHDAVGERLRETLRAYLACGRNKARAAESLHVHQKTVAYRIAQAEELLGRHLDTGAADLEAALLIDLTLFGP